MRWFKHMTRAWDDEKISALVEKHGIEGYGFYFRVLEIVAGTIEESSQSSVTYSLRKWSKLTAIFQPKVLRLCQVCDELGLIQYELSAESLKVSIPKIFKYRDEYSEKREKKKLKNRDIIPSVSEKYPRRADTDTEADTEAEAEKNAIPQKIADLLKPLNKISPSPLEIKNLSLAAKAGCTQDTVKNLLRRKPAITGFSHSWQVDELMAQLRIDKGDGDDIDAELERRYGKRSN